MMSRRGLGLGRPPGPTYLESQGSLGETVDRDSHSTPSLGPFRLVAGLAGLKILSVYMTGSKNMSYDSANLTTSDIKVGRCGPFQGYP